MPDAQAVEHLTFVDVVAWRAWLDENQSISEGAWVTLAKKGTHTPTSLSYAQALEEALCSGWIDGRKRSIDRATFSQHFTPRRKRSIWSQRNVDLVTKLTGEGRMRERGMVEVDRARADGRWERAYAGAASMAIPDDLHAALEKNPAADRVFRSLTKSDQYAVLLDIVTSSSQAIRESRIDRHVMRMSLRPE